MKSSAISIFSGLLLLVGGFASCKGNPPSLNDTNPANEAAKGKNPMKESKIRIVIGARTFKASLADNPTASAFKAMLPISLEMSDLHGNEKFFHLSSRMPSKDEKPGNIQVGDLMLWSSKSLVLFYQTFPTPYSYTRIGSIDNPEGLSTAVGSDKITIKFEAD